MLYLHDRYALDGDDPNTYTNILWCFGLHDRPWPKRPVFGTIRSMVALGHGTEDQRRVRIYGRSNLELTGKDDGVITMTGRDWVDRATADEEFTCGRTGDK